MRSILKQIFSFILPLTALVIIPAWVEKKWRMEMSFHLCMGMLLILLGLTMMVLTISAFARVGKGTLAPWAPPEKLVVSGLYRYVRNPMIMGVLIVLLGEALSIQSKNILIWAAGFFVINIIYFIIYEEPQLEKRFGEPYRQYKKHVSMWIPHLRPYNQDKIIKP